MVKTRHVAYSPEAAQRACVENTFAPAQPDPDVPGMADPLTMDPVHPGTVYDTPSMLTDIAKADERAEDHAQAPAAATHPTASGRSHFGYLRLVHSIS